MSACNLNRVNGDFTGTSQINRALLNRYGVTFDFDYFDLTDGDRDALDAMESSGRPKLAPIRDISDKILAAHEKIKAAASQRDPWLDAYIRIFSIGLEYCNKDKDEKKKKIWPSNCDGCTFANKDLCSLVKQSTTRTAGALKKFALGIDYLIKLKYGEVITDPFDLAMESFKFTTYHGNLNGISVMSKYQGEDQEQMRDVITLLRDKITPIRKYMDGSIDEAVNNGRAETRFIEYDASKSEKKRILYSKELKDDLEKPGPNKKKLTYRVIDPFKEFEKSTGIDMKWFKKYVDGIVHSKSREQTKEGE